MFTKKQIQLIAFYEDNKHKNVINILNTTTSLIFVNRIYFPNEQMLVS